MQGNIHWWRWAMVLAWMALLAGCARPAPEQRVRQAVAQMQAAIEARDVGKAMQPVAADFVGEQGLDAAGLRLLLQLQLLGNRKIGVTLGPVDVQLKGATATASFTALLTGGDGRWLPEQAQTYQLTTGWRLQDGDWRLYHAQWAPAGR
ncbi:nuclear transport factor 2 family protein [Xanthomonas sp. NCPPB 3582]|uniref:nuclear transport factor 2 family protein n=1 Tax=Xanthomonas sp. NCPPB 3582 TaxID=487557 RepID=UPI003556D59A